MPQGQVGLCDSMAEGEAALVGFSGGPSNHQTSRNRMKGAVLT